MTRLLLIVILLVLLEQLKAELPTSISDTLNTGCGFAGSSLTSPILYQYTNTVFTYNSWPTNPLNATTLPGGSSYNSCSTNEIGVQATGVWPYTDPEPGVEVNFNINAQEFEIREWDSQGGAITIFDEDDRSLTNYIGSGNSDPQWVLVQYASKKSRNIRLYFQPYSEYSGNLPKGMVFNGINVQSSDSVSTDTGWQPGMMVVGDSYVLGFDISTLDYWWYGYVTVSAYGTGAGNFHTMGDGVGGTGFLNNNQPDGGTNYAARFLKDVLPYTNQVRFIVIQASLNDSHATNTSQQFYTSAQYYTAMTNYIGMVKTYCPAQEVAVLGIPYNDAGDAITNIINNTNCINGCAALHIPFFDAIDQLYIPPSDIGFDGVHPTITGYQLISNYLISKMQGTFADFPGTTITTNRASIGPPAAQLYF